MCVLVAGVEKRVRVMNDEQHEQYKVMRCVWYFAMQDDVHVMMSTFVHVVSLSSDTCVC